MTCKPMDKTCETVNRLLQWVGRDGAPAIPYAGRGFGGFKNPPATQVEIIYYESSGVDNLHIGDLSVDVPPYHVSIHNVHHGNYTDTLQRFRAWCLFLDVGGVDEFRDMARAPFFTLSPLPGGRDVIREFEHLARHCNRYGSGPRHYLAPDYLFRPERDTRRIPTAATHVQAALLELLAVILDGIAPKGPSTARPAYSQAVVRAIEFMDLEYRSPDLTLDMIAASACLSPDHFGRVFKAETEDTPMYYLRAIRTAHAAQLLLHTDLSVEQVACEVGFVDPFHFSRVFRQTTGKSPSRLRAENG